MDFLRWVKWYFWTARRCAHTPGDWQFRDMGMGKIQYCTKCGKCTGLI